MYHLDFGQYPVEGMNRKTNAKQNKLEKQLNMKREKGKGKGAITRGLDGRPFSTGYTISLQINVTKQISAHV